ncbi:branched-chain amino acid ABC transporter permease [Rhodoferax sp.]|uniref:branched-chain amino acid ABC transporter permease n=1 Tax=Rhodoferax sp. TaxID=50421 RepID=UPI0008CBF340|nr:branched-chain amino acid ABC transporter permease [Rhodoferax sp.]OGB40692.1 MAG: branched-chain amino acid ABC transporter permease [Burkholderiales bacterium RIFOXYC2_FULL_59_8]OGB50643.1 MAG: branched-chain amino acid ABC transporter permease [Burkholderiales bacterium RIFOXYD12_FULL_59_19]OGB77182.1 MAG: branched-chain amino acid ABC transporter permease [Burkholderiales bacterium RIFOXYC12_FULL_60_6]OGB81268.1 MAG: branched-chain amino acid ABC transporter permease [Burkholderiales bac
MKKSPFIGLYIIMAVLLVLPFVLPNSFYVDLAIRMAINAIIVLGLNLLIGFAGQISLGHAGFLGIGAYATAALPSHFGWHPMLALLAGAAAAGLLAAIVARPIFKLKGHYLAMATLGLGIIINIVVRNEAAWTGGPDGMPVPAMSLAGFEISGDKHWYWIVAVLLSVSVWASLNLIDSPFGRALRALHGSEVASKVVGVDVVRYKVAIFVLSAVFASIMGSVTAHYVGFVTPNLADFFHSIELVTMVVIGGMASVYGSVVGAVLLTALPQALTSFEGWETVIFGAILMLCMIFLPKGLVPTLAAKFSSGE